MKSGAPALNSLAKSSRSLSSAVEEFEMFEREEGRSDPFTGLPPLSEPGCGRMETVWKVMFYEEKCKEQNMLYGKKKERKKLGKNIFPIS